jgi:hypothetical protein
MPKFAKIYWLFEALVIQKFGAGFSIVLELKWSNFNA